MRTKKAGWWLAGVTVAIGGIAVWWAVAYPGEPAQPAQVGLPSAAEALEKRLELGEAPLPQTITMDNTAVFKKNGINGVFAIQLVEGELTGPSEGTVLTDEVCEPDKNDLYHCWNDIRLSDGTVIRGLTIHDMEGGVPCLSPETKVRVTPYRDGYFLLER